MMLVVAANPIQKLRPAVGAGNLYRVMRASKSHAFFHQCAQGSRMVYFQGRMPESAIRIDEDRIRVVEGKGVLWPAIGINHRGNAGDFFEAFFEQ